MARTIGKNGLELIKHFEGCFSSIPNSAALGKIKPKPVTNLHNTEQMVYSYRCSANVATIGWGNTRWADDTPVVDGDECTLAEANELYETEVDEFAHNVDKLVTNPHVTQNMFDALVSFAYNAGVGNLRASTLLKTVNAGNFAGCREQFMRWNKAGGKELLGLTRRRSAEADLFETPDNQ
jgi:lysozyme